MLGVASGVVDTVGVIDGVGDVGTKVSIVNAHMNDASKFSISNNRLSPDSLVNSFPGDKL